MPGRQVTGKRTQSARNEYFGEVVIDGADVTPAALWRLINCCVIIIFLTRGKTPGGSKITKVDRAVIIIIIIIIDMFPREFKN